MKKYNLKKAFTLIEVMILVIIIGLITSMAIPIIQKIRAQHQQQHQQMEAPVERRAYRSDSHETKPFGIGFFMVGFTIGLGTEALVLHLVRKNREKNSQKMLRNRW